MNDAIRARFPGYCPSCEKRIYLDEMIVKVEGEWLHEGCIEYEMRVATSSEGPEHAHALGRAEIEDRP